MNIPTELEEDLREMLKYILETEEDNFREQLMSGDMNATVSLTDEEYEDIDAGGASDYVALDAAAAQPTCTHIYARAYRLNLELFARTLDMDIVLAQAMAMAKKYGNVDNDTGDMIPNIYLFTGVQVMVNTLAELYPGAEKYKHGLFSSRPTFEQAADYALVTATAIGGTECSNLMRKVIEDMRKATLD